SATLKVNAGITTTGPTDATVCQGRDASFSTLASGTGPFTYQWSLDGTATGSNAASLSVNTSALTIGNHTLRVIVTGQCGSVTNSATLTVNTVTSATDLSDLTVSRGADANFATTASGSASFNYQWTLDGNAAGTNGPSLTVPTGSLTLGAHTVTA